jgi:hypothetical protein
LSQPAPGSPQLIAVSPRGTAAGTPLLLDWLLLEAPLQNLRSGDASWRLRVSLNGDSFLIDQQTPLWLEGWRSGSNAIQLDLLDGLGEPLNSPFNSLVSEVILEPGAAAPRWQGGRLQPGELAILLGEAPPPVALDLEPDPEPETEPMPEPEPETAADPAPEVATEVVTGAGPAPASELETEVLAEVENPAEIESSPAVLANPPEPPTAAEVAEPPLEESVTP